MKKQVLERFEELVLENDEQRALIGSFRTDEKIWAEREQEAHRLTSVIQAKETEIAGLKAKLAAYEKPKARAAAKA